MQQTGIGGSCGNLLTSSAVVTQNAVQTRTSCIVERSKLFIMGGSCSGGAPPSTIGKHERGVAVGGPKAHNVQVRLPKQLSTYVNKCVPTSTACCSSHHTLAPSLRAVIGLEHAGKSTVLHTLARRRTLRIQQSGANLVSTPPPTVASRSVKVDLDAFVLKAVDTPGRDR